jgi:multidrug efflux pump subunit AcrA (membrane-fusion protein)
MNSKVSFFAIAMALANCAHAESGQVEVPSVLIKLIEHIEVPARQSGALEQVNVREGDMVEAGTLLAKIEDADVQFDMRRAQLELSAARKQAENDVKVRFARKSLEVAEAEQRRALDSQKRLSQSVSQSELDQLRLIAQRSALEVEQAQFEMVLAQATRELKENEVSLAEHSIRERQVKAPLTGLVTEVKRRQGEWVEPGQTIARVLRLDRLRAEGLASAEVLGRELHGRTVKLTVQLEGKPAEFSGKVVFVSPEIDPVNGQVRVWAEIDNKELKLRPGLHGSMTILDAPQPTR